MRQTFLQERVGLLKLCFVTVPQNKGRLQLNFSMRARECLEQLSPRGEPAAWTLPPPGNRARRAEGWIPEP